MRLPWFSASRPFYGISTVIHYYVWEYDAWCITCFAREFCTFELFHAATGNGPNFAFWRRKRRRRRGRRGGVWDAFDFLLRNMRGDQQQGRRVHQSSNKISWKSKTRFTIHVYVQKYELEGGQTQTLVRLAGLCWHFPWGQTRSLSYCYFFIFNAIYLFIYLSATINQITQLYVGRHSHCVLVLPHSLFSTAPNQCSKFVLQKYFLTVRHIFARKAFFQILLWKY